MGIAGQEGNSMQEMFLVAIMRIIVILMPMLFDKLAENTTHKMLLIFHLICDP